MPATPPAPAPAHLNGHASAGTQHDSGPRTQDSGPRTESSHSPPLHPDDDARLLEDFLRANCSLHELAWRNGITIDQLIAWAESPETLRRVEALERIAERQAKAAATLARPVAIGGLDAHVRSHQHDEYHQLLKPCRETSALVLRQRESARRAASTLLRAGAAPSSPLGGGVLARRSPARTEGAPSSSAFSPCSTGQAAPYHGGRLAALNGTGATACPGSTPPTASSFPPPGKPCEESWSSDLAPSDADPEEDRRGDRRSLGSHNPRPTHFTSPPSSSHKRDAAFGADPTSAANTSRSPPHPPRRAPPRSCHSPSPAS